MELQSKVLDHKKLLKTHQMSKKDRLDILGIKPLSPSALSNTVVKTERMQSNEQRDIKGIPYLKTKVVESTIVTDRKHGILPYEPSSSTIEGQQALDN